MKLQTNHGAVDLPAFFPDGTYGVVRCTDAGDLRECQIPGLVMNSYHLLTKPGVNVLKSCGFRRLSGVLHDSGE